MKTLKYFLIIVCFLPKLAQSYQADQNFIIEAAIFNNTKGHISYAVNSENYFVISSIKTDGLLNKIYNYSAKYETNGKIAGDKTIAASYQYHSSGNSTQRTKLIEMDDSGIPIRRLSSKNSKKKENTIEKPRFAFDAPDMQTAFILLVRQFREKNFCDMEKEIYDGKKHYRIIFRDLGKSFPADAKINIDGDVWQCSMRMQQLKEDDKDLLWDLTSNTPINFWIAKDKETNIPYIVKIQIDSTPIGCIKAYNIKNHLGKE